MHIDKNSYGTLALVYIIGAIILVPFLVCFSDKLWVIPIVAFILIFCVWQTAFFRVPDRLVIGTGHDVCSGADGKVVIIEKAFENEYLKRECIQVSVYMDFFDVHANFWPLSGEVTYYKYHPGKHLLAFKPKASEDNEHTTAVIRNEDGTEVLFRQLAGTFARRIVCYAEPGLQVEASKQCGIIKFGSRLDIFLPLDAEIKVKLGEKVRAAESIIATLSSPNA